MQANIAPGGRVEQLPDTIGIPPLSIPSIGEGIEIDYHLDDTKPLSDYRRRGVDYIATIAGNPYLYRTNPRRYPKQADFYTQLACKTRLVAVFPRSSSHFGPGISIYRIDQAPDSLLDVFCDQPIPSRS